MASPGGSAAPPKPWERSASSSAAGPSPFRPSSGINNTAAVVESAGVSDSADNKNAIANTSLQTQNGASVGRPMPPRPWERNSPGGYSMTNYNQYSSLGTNSNGTNPYYGGTYNNYNRGYGSSYGGGMYGGGYGLGSSYGGGLYGGNSYGGGMYGGGYGMGMGMGMGMGGPGSFENGPGGDPNNPFGGGPPAGPPTFWQSMLKVMHGVVIFFGRVSFLVDQNTQAFHFFITALLQLFDRSGMLYGELARFVLRLLGVRSRPRVQPIVPSMPLPGQQKPANYLIEGPKEAGGTWDNVWPSDDMNMAG